ncbi:hormogonium polysaccharide biosynthesis protein HpsL [Okeania sp.]|uniref:hormogonium polysaccharide biosynthesis protein HpsL n=1 Tax=Okeania sp. TaxID=3100323 RepID=UPI002B4B7EF2|nr:hormogonium polysaccharide biosynthesis protein HpsL [Okeania sp.]MEB3341028.1 hormogonium polysaccharide biosynthesis protein HpsL [Okeania sp.]
MPTKKKSKKKSKKKGKPAAPQISKKELAARKRQRAKQIQELIGSLVTYGGIGVVIGIVLFFVAEPKIALAGGGGIAVLALSYKYPMLGLWGFMIYMPFAGTVTYWIGGGSPIFQLAKDGFYVPAIIAIGLWCKNTKNPFIIPKAMKNPLYILLGFCLVTLLLVNGSQQLNPPIPGDKAIPMGILGLKAMIGYLPLITGAYYKLKSKKELLFAARLTVILAIVCCLLGVVQYQFLSSGKCNGTRGKSGDDLFKATLEAKCLVGGALLFSPSEGVIRLPGTFVAPWQWAWFLISNAAFTFAVAFSDPSGLWRIAGLFGMAVVFVNAAISGQRIALALVPAVTIILLVLTGQVTNLKRFLPIGIGLGVLLGGIVVSNPAVVQERIDSFVGRWEASPPTAFITQQFEESNHAQDGIFGAGLGRATNSARAFGKTRLIETYYPKLIYEVGPIGTIAMLVLLTSITVSGFKAYRSVKDKNLRSLGASYWVFVLIISYNTYYYPLDVDPVAVYYWYFAGVIFRIPEIDKQEQKKLQEAEEN